ncbi:putative oleosin [Helianthus annuus]|nr:putative oleosin [Helianthus annuus]KAJ0558721.1 putative oleosin [Helianthus annuus]KAJ0564620.1 putative oleosin [Helianthus annuus]KAJ0729963.1 putative oleosin [Helianthus annuus]KAJ0732661.1 putative oleosin [Helianthus annuus]
MTDIHTKEQGQQQSRWHVEPQHQSQHWTTQSQRQWNEPRAHQVVKAATAAAVGGSLLVLAGLVLAGTVIALTLATPVLVIFSPVLVPALIAVFLLVSGFLTSGGFGVAAATVLAWMYRYVTGEQPSGADTSDEASHRLGAKARDIKDRGEHAGRGGHYGTAGVHTGGPGGGVGTYV